MVEANGPSGSKTQLPNPKNSQDDEENKVDMDEAKFMYGSAEDLKNDFWYRIGEAKLNELEKQLLNRLLEKP